MTRGSGATGCLAAAMLLTAGLVGCTDEDTAELTTPPTTLVEGVPVRADATSGPGTELVAGFSVVEGSVLLGSVFPADYRDSSRGLFDRVTTALLLVTGDARQVFDAYADQAAAIGLPVGPESSSGLCHEERSSVFQCSAGAEQGDPATAYRSVRMGLWRAPATRDRPPLSHLFLEYGERGSAPEGPVTHRQVAGPGSGRGPFPTEWPPLADVGEPYESADAQPALVVEEGTELVAHPGWSVACGGGGSTAVFRVRDDTEAVLGAVARQQPSGEGWRNDYAVEQTVEGGSTLRRINWRVNGGSYRALTVERPGEPAYLLVDHCTAD